MAGSLASTSSARYFGDLRGSSGQRCRSPFHMCSAAIEEDTHCSWNDRTHFNPSRLGKNARWVMVRPHHSFRQLTLGHLLASVDPALDSSDYPDRAAPRKGSLVSIQLWDKKQNRHQLFPPKGDPCRQLARRASRHARASWSIPRQSETRPAVLSQADPITCP